MLRQKYDFIFTLQRLLGFRPSSLSPRQLLEHLLQLLLLAVQGEDGEAVVNGKAEDRRTDVKGGIRN